MLAINMQWDGATLAQITNFHGYDQYVNELLDDLADAYGDAGVDFIKPQLRGNGKWQASTGETADGLDYEVKRKGNDGWTMNFVGRHMSDGRNVAAMIDVGNFDENDVIHASSHGMKAFPISARTGTVHTFLTYIHGMGHSSPEYPKFFSDNAVYELNDDTPRLAERHLQRFLDRLVM